MQKLIRSQKGGSRQGEEGPPEPHEDEVVIDKNESAEKEFIADSYS